MGSFTGFFNEAISIPESIIDNFSDSLSRINDMYKKEYNSKQYIRIKSFDLKEFSKYITVVAYQKENIYKLNNIAFYLADYGNLSDAIAILAYVIEISPERSVAYLNIADIYWKMKDYENAIINYREYIEHMQKENKSDKIPSRIQQTFDHLMSN